MLQSDQHGREHGDVGVVRWQDVKCDHETSNYLRLAVLDRHELTMTVSAFCRSLIRHSNSVFRDGSQPRSFYVVSALQVCSDIASLMRC
jgi:hypothetical protein